MHDGTTAHPQAAATGPATRHDAALPADTAGWRLDRALAAAIPLLSREPMKALVGPGQVEVAGKIHRDPATRVKGGEAVCVAIPAPRPAEALAQDIPLVIIFADEHLLVVDKPAGLVVHLSLIHI